MTFISTIRGGQSQYLPLLLAKLSEVLPNLPLPRSLNLSHTVPVPELGLNATNSGTPSSDVGNGFLENHAATLLTYILE